MTTDEQLNEKALAYAMDWVFSYIGDKYTNEQIMDILLENKLKTDYAQSLFSEFEEPTIWQMYEGCSPRELYSIIDNFRNDIIQFHKELSL
jgi:acetone carboxylase gamma subunit